MSNKLAGLFGLIIFLVILIMFIFIYNHFTDDTYDDGSKNESSISNVLKKQNVDGSLQDTSK